MVDFYLSYYKAQNPVINISGIEHLFHYNITMYFHKVYINHTARVCIYFNRNFTCNGPMFWSEIYTLTVIFHIPFDCHRIVLEAVLGSSLMNTRVI